MGAVLLAVRAAPGRQLESGVLILGAYVPLIILSAWVIGVLPMMNGAR